MKNLTIDALAAACGGALCGTAPAGEISAVVTDSRKVTPGCLFAAIRGEQVDGHDYVNQSFAQGAACAVVERVPEGAEGCMILVPDTLAALQKIASFYREQFPALPVIGVTGSVGKTTAKEMLWAVLSRKYDTHKTAGNYNNDLGVPLTLFGLREGHGAAVVELGVSHPGDMARIASIARPTMALYTNIGDAHLEFLGSREGILREKSAMNAWLPAEGAVFCNGDDPLLAGMLCKQRKVTFGLGEGNAVRAANLAMLPDATTACTVIAGERRFDVVIPAFGEHLVYAALGAAAVGLEMGLTPEEIAAGISAYAPVGSRGRLLHTGFLTVVDDCYNANPTSAAAAIRSLARLPGRKVCILGDMLELGERSAALHRETGALARDCGIDLVLTVGPEAEQIAAGAGDVARQFSDKPALLAALSSLLLPGDTVLVKASRGMRFEEIVAFLEELRPCAGE